MSLKTIYTTEIVVEKQRFLISQRVANLRILNLIFLIQISSIKHNTVMEQKWMQYVKHTFFLPIFALSTLVSGIFF